MEHTTIDADIDNYSVDDLLTIFNLTSNPTIHNVTDVANDLIARMTTQGNTDLAVFFGLARDKVVAYLNAPIPASEIQNEMVGDISGIWSATSFTDNSPTHVRYFDDGTRPIGEYKNIVAQNIAPIIAIQLLTIDSQYRSIILPYSDSPLATSFNTNYTFNISDPITKAMSIRLYSYQIPTTWFAFNAQAGNTFFMYNGIIIVIPDGNYTRASIVAAINLQAQANIATNGLYVSYDEASGKISFTNNDLLSNDISIIFYIQSNVVNFNNCGKFILANFQTTGINNTLGWLLGFRTTPNAVTGDVVITIMPGQTITAEALPDTYGPKYFILSVEEYSNQRLTSGLYNITKTKNLSNITIQDYFTTVQVACKLREGTLTNAQQYAINAVTTSSQPNNNSTGFSNKLSGPIAGAAFAIIPLQEIPTIRPNPYVKFGADLEINQRRYKAPVNLERINVRLSDDKGNLVNLHDNDWSFSLIVETRLN